MFKLGLCSVTFREKPAEEIIEIARQQELEGIEWGADVHVKPDSPAEYAAGVAEKCRNAGLAIPSYGSYFDVLDHAPADFAAIVEKAALLGAGVIRVWGGWVRPEEVNPEQFEKITSTSRKIAGMAAEKNIKVAFAGLLIPDAGTENTDSIYIIFVSEYGFISPQSPFNLI